MPRFALSCIGYDGTHSPSTSILPVVCVCVCVCVVTAGRGGNGMGCIQDGIVSLHSMGQDRTGQDGTG
jgi:hypothetical protein